LASYYSRAAVEKVLGYLELDGGSYFPGFSGHIDEVRASADCDWGGQAQYIRQIEALGLVFALSGDQMDPSLARGEIDAVVEALHTVELSYVNEPYHTRETSLVEVDGELQEVESAVQRDYWVLYAHVREGDFQGIIDGRLASVPEEDRGLALLRMDSFRRTLGLGQFLANPLSPDNSVDWRGLITSVAGSRIMDREAEEHTGIDLGIPVGTPLYAVKDGVVARAGDGGSAGLFVELYVQDGGGDEVAVTYMHMDSVGVSQGDAVSKGQFIGLSGNTGRSTGPHLHLQAVKGGSVLNPLFLLEFPSDEAASGLAD
jgi:hypothetical protein